MQAFANMPEAARQQGGILFCHEGKKAMINENIAAF